jgi:hypothetical protein
MRAEIRELIAKKPFHRQGLRDIAALLPEQDAELHESLRNAIAQNDDLNFTFLIFAAAMAGRTLPASMLHGGTTLLPDDWRFAWIAWRMEGDVTSALVEAADAEAIPMSRRAMALFIAAAWWKEHRRGEELPRSIASVARDISSAKHLEPETVAYLGALMVLLTEDGAVADTNGPRAVQAKKGRLAVEKTLNVVRGPFEALVPERETSEFTGNRTRRRAVERIGRNERCPCGSGKKYKQCCFEKDQERLRLRNATDVAGKTRAEVERDLNADLTKRRLELMMPANLVKLDPTRIPVELQEDYLLRLGAFRHFDALAEAFEKIGVPQHLQKVWSFAFHFAISSWQRDLVLRLLNTWPDAEKTLGAPQSGVPLILAADHPGKFLETLEAECLKALKSDDPLAVYQLGAAMLSSPYSALGILLARGALPIVEYKTASPLFEDILSVRGKLNLSPNDEFSDLMDERATRERGGDESAPLQEAQEKLETKAEEVRQLREKLTALERQIRLREKQESREAAATMNSPAADGQILRELRGKLGQLKSLLKERGEERVALRRDVEKLHQEMESLKSAPASGEMEASVVSDEGEGERIEISGNQPVRLIQFPKKFAETLARFPQHVARTAMNRIGRIASGEASALSELVKICNCEDVLRLRVAGDYRLLLQLFPDHVNVVDVVNRRDLQRRLKVLRTSGVPATTG